MHVVELFYILIVVDTQTYTLIKLYRTQDTHMHTHIPSAYETGETWRVLADCIKVNFLAVILRSSYARCYLWGKRTKGYAEYVYIIS